MVPPEDSSPAQRPEVVASADAALRGTQTAFWKNGKQDTQAKFEGCCAKDESSIAHHKGSGR